MGFAALIKQEQEKLEKQSGGNSNSVKYPETKHKRLFMEKGVNELLLQVLPSADLMSSFVEPVRKIFINAKTSQGKEMNVNFTLDADMNQGSLLENKVVEWGAQGLMPTPFGGQQTPSRRFLVNVVLVIKDQHGQFVQERDEHGALVVRVYELPQSGYTNLIKKLQDELLNPNPSSDLSFMNPANPLLVKIARPGKGQMEYPVDVYTNIPLPALEQGWENQLEDLKAQGVPTERLEGGAEWVQAFVDMKEGRKPNQTGNEAQGQAPQTPATNPYAVQPPVQQQQQQNYPPQQQQQQQNYPPQQQQAPQYTQAPSVPQYEQAPSVPQAPQTAPPVQNTPAPPVAPPAQQAPPVVPPVAPPVQQAPPVAPPVQQAPPADAPATNSNNLNDIDAMLAAELNG